MSETQNSEAQPPEKTQSKPPVQPQIQYSVQPQSQPQIEPQSQPPEQPQSQPQIEPQLQPPEQPQSQPQIESQAQPKVEPQNQPLVQPQSQPPIQPQVQPQIEPKPQKEEKYHVVINKNTIQFDILKINSYIKKESSYKADNYIFEFYNEYKSLKKDEEEEEDEDDNIPKYFVDIKSEHARYLGILSKSLKKEVFGYSLYDNGDEYFGQWYLDKKEGFGIYYFKENEKEEAKVNHIYIGEFKNNVKSGEGLYFKIKKFEEKENVNKPLDFTFAIGNFSYDNLKNGIIYNIEGDKRKIYKGKMNGEGEKDDENAEIYENENQIFNGLIKKNIMIKGRIIILKGGEKDLEKEEAYYFERKGDKINSDEIDFDYRKGEEKDDEYIQKMKDMFKNYDCEKLKDLYLKVMELREKIKSPEGFEYLKNLNYDEMIKEELKKLYGKYLYID